jgi:ribonuclease P protein component
MQTFRKDERLCSKKIIHRLFLEGNDFSEFPFKVIWMFVSLSTENATQILISIPMKNFKKAVDRNYLKRMIREAYRLNKATLQGSLSANQRQLAFSLIYIGKNILTYKEIENKIILILQRLQQLNENNSE